MREKSGMKTALIVLLSVLLLTGVIIFFYLYFGSNADDNRIQLPATQTQPDPEEPGKGEGVDFATVGVDNVRDVLAQTPQTASYYQTLTLATIWSEGKSERQIEIFHSEGLTSLRIHSEKTVQYYLTDGQTLYLWYEGDETAFRTQLSEELADSLILGIPNYRVILERAHILQAEYVPVDDIAGARIFVTCGGNAGFTHRYWVDLNSGLLLRMDIMQDEQLTAQLTQQSLTLASPGDELFQSAFLLPDGSVPFPEGD